MFESHAYIAKGTEHDLAEVLHILEQELSISRGDPDFFVRFYKTFTIDDARDIIARAANRAIGARRVFVVGVSNIQLEAQNALLKTLEEMPNGGLLILLHPAPAVLLPTVLSRVLPLPLTTLRNADSVCLADAFLRAKTEARLDMVKKLLEKDDDDAIDVGAIVEFLSEVERSLTSKKAEALRAVYRARKYSGDRGALLKPLLEQLALLA